MPAASALDVDALLPPMADGSVGGEPPGADDTRGQLPHGGPSPGRQVALPPGAMFAAGPSRRAKDGGVLLPTEDGTVVALRDPVKTIGVGDEERELRQLSAEEKARRRFRRNVVIWILGFVMIAITLGLLLSMGPVRG